tara:strand:- start:17247 stop:17369 length:123 start_codon:yes stop_codon:yes gene_type:complete
MKIIFLNHLVRRQLKKKKKNSEKRLRKQKMCLQLKREHLN